MLEVAVARSTMAHARIVSIDTSAAEAVPGVVAIVTSENVTDHVNPNPDFGPEPTSTPGTASRSTRCATWARAWPPWPPHRAPSPRTPPT